MSIHLDFVLRAEPVLDIHLEPAEPSGWCCVVTTSRTTFTATHEQPDAALALALLEIGQ